MANQPKDYAVQLLAILYRDRDRLERIDNYAKGIHDDPYMPPNADAEYKMLARRAVSNWIPLLVSTPAQALYVDDFRRGRASADEDATDTSPEMKHWQKSRLDARQMAVHRGALTFGHSFVVTEKVKGKVLSRGLSAMSTAALFDDPANDLVPLAALTVIDEPREKSKGTAVLWDGKNSYAVTFKGYEDAASVRVANGKKHGYTECPVTRFASAVDLEGRTVGLVEPMIPLQNRINQTVFDLLVTQTYASFKVRWVTGMAPPMQMVLLDQDGNETNDPNLAVDARPKLDAKGNPIPQPVNHNAKRFLFAEDPGVQFGTLDETPLAGFIDSIEASIRHLAAISQTPPHHLLGQIANLSAEALLAAETALARKVEEIRTAFGESWERVFQVAMALEGNEAAADDDSGEVLWRDMEQRSLAQSADALGKLADQLGIPTKGLWNRVPGVTRNELKKWNELAEEEPDYQLSQFVRPSRTVPDSAPAPLDDEAA